MWNAKNILILYNFVKKGSGAFVRSNIVRNSSISAHQRSIVLALPRIILASPRSCHCNPIKEKHHCRCSSILPFSFLQFILHLSTRKCVYIESLITWNPSIRVQRYVVWVRWNESVANENTGERRKLKRNEQNTPPPPPIPFTLPPKKRKKKKKKNNDERIIELKLKKRKKKGKKKKRNKTYVIRIWNDIQAHAMRS